MSEIIDVFVSLDAMDEPLAQVAASALGRAPESVGAVRVLRRSLDARKGRRLGYQMRLGVFAPGEVPQPPALSAPRRAWPSGVPAPRVVIVGSGPAGAWAALRLAE